LKTYQISVNGQQYDVEIEDLNASPVTVQVNGQSFQVTITSQGTKRAQRQAIPAQEPKFEMDAYVPTVTATYQEIDVDESTARDEPSAGTTQAAAEGAITVSAPMPGTVLDIAVKVGERVGQGDTLCNLEAMKMKSPIRSPGEGTVAQILISEGQNVGYGKVLFTLN
jgi:biotin carboxyl carrier protein